MSLSAHRLSVCLIALSVVAGSACSGTPSAGEAGYQFNLAGHYASDMSVRNTTYSGSIDLATHAGGVLSGTMKLTAPIDITAKLTGVVSGDSLTFGGPYRTPDCTGVLRAQGRIAEGGRTAWGSIKIDDGCVGAMAGSFRLKR